MNTNSPNNEKFKQDDETTFWFLSVVIPRSAFVFAQVKQPDQHNNAKQKHSIFNLSLEVKYILIICQISNKKKQWKPPRT
jgi:hypothetical protein